MSSGRRVEADLRVLERVKRSPIGITALEIGRAYLGHRARRMSASALTMTGLAIAARLCGAGLIEPTRTNQFRLKREAAA
jgi:hypothetical protein